MHVLGVAITQTIHKCQSRLINFKRNCQAIEFVRSAVARSVAWSVWRLSRICNHNAGRSPAIPTNQPTNPWHRPNSNSTYSSSSKPNPSQFKLNLKPNQPKHLGQSDNQFAESTKCVQVFWCFVFVFCVFFEKLHLIVKQNGKQRVMDNGGRRYKGDMCINLFV